MSEKRPVLWFGPAAETPPDEVAGHAVTTATTADAEAALASVAERDPAGVVYAQDEADAFLDGLRVRRPDLPVVLLADPADCEAGLTDEQADVVRPTDAAAEGAAARLGALVAEDGAASTPVETLVRYETILEAVGDGVYALDADYRYVLVNEALCEMTGYGREELLGSHVSPVLTGEDLASGVAARKAARADPGTLQRVSLELERADGTVVPVENRFAAVSIEGSFAGTVGVVRDVTQRRERERELRRKTESLEAFASLVGHDLRNPLAVADGYLGELAADVDHPAIDDVEAALQRMTHIVDDLLLLARGDDAIDPEPVVLADAVVAAWELVPTSTATLAVDVDPDRRLLASESHLRSLLENLFRNCVDHGGRDVHVSVEADEDGFSVADDGPGFPESVQGRAFERGVSGEDGTGLGLAIVRSVADAHGWTVAVGESDAGGTRVDVHGVEWTAF